MSLLIRNVVVIALSLIFFVHLLKGMSKDERNRLKDQAREMFYHAYHSYMKNAYPADELMPLSCKGRFRDTEPSRGDIDDALGNFSLTLVDTLDTLVLLGDLDEFEHAVRLIIKDISFDNDVIVSVFETNIRMLGGLLSGHILATYLQEEFNRMNWYRGELLIIAEELGQRLLPAFNTSTGIPHPRINLRYGLKSPKLGVVRETCTACAGTMILEFAALSRLTGNTIYEEKAKASMDYLWQQRHRTSDLMGTVLNIHNGDWVRRDSGVGAGIDSYYEYCLKAYVLLGEDSYLERFNKHYSAVMKYVSQGPLLVDVHMHRPHTNTRNFMDALLAFWPGLQVLKGDIKPAIEIHEMLYQVIQRHNFLPEAFTVDFQVHWGQHPLRPEFVESTYFLYKATTDPYYLEVGKKVLESLQQYARVPCGFAAVKDVRTGNHEDRMDSFVLAETLKYLYLLFTSKEELLLDIDDFVFTTEAHLLPLSISRLNSSSFTKITFQSSSATLDSADDDFTHTCPNTHYLFPEGKNFAHSIRQPLKNLVEGICPPKIPRLHRLHASEFQATNEDHLRIIKKMGINVVMLADGRIQLVHNTAQADTAEDGEEGVIFMQEMIELSKTQSQQEQHLYVVYFSLPNNIRIVLNAGPAQFGIDLKDKSPIQSEIEVAQPLRACCQIYNAAALKGKIAVIERGDCMFIEKARHIQSAGAVAGIVLDNNPGTSSQSSPMFAMSGDGNDDIKIPMVFLFSEDGQLLLNAFRQHPDLVVSIADAAAFSNNIQKKDISTKENAKVLENSSSTEDAEDSHLNSEKWNTVGAYQRMRELSHKLQSLQKIKVDIDQLVDLSKHLGNKEESEEVEFQHALEKLMGKEKLLDIDQDVMTLLLKIRELIHFRNISSDFKNTFVEDKDDIFKRSLNPSTDVKAFKLFMTRTIFQRSNIKNNSTILDKKTVQEMFSKDEL